MITAASIITGATPGNEGADNEVVIAKLANKFTSQLKDALKDGMGNGNMGMENTFHSVSIFLRFS